MYNDFTFAEDSKVEIFKVMNEALKKSYEVTVNPISTVVENIQVTSKGSIIFEGQEKKISQRGMESFFKILGIPLQFARKLPTDLLLHNVSKLTADNPSAPIFVLERPNAEIASIVGDPYSEIPYSDILGNFTERPVRSIEMSESLLKVCFTFDNLKVSDLNDNQDTLYVGEFLVASLTKLSGLQAYVGLYRTQCENSFIMPLLGRLKANYLKKEDARLSRFVAAFECYNTDTVATVLGNLAQKKQAKLKEYQVKQVWERMSKIMSKSDADILFSFDEDMRNSFLSKAKGYLSEYKQAEKLGLPLPTPTETPYDCYKVANEITNIAHTRSFDAVDQLKAEMVGGNILQWMIFNN